MWSLYQTLRFYIDIMGIKSNVLLMSNAIRAWMLQRLIYSTTIGQNQSINHSIEKWVEDMVQPANHYLTNIGNTHHWILKTAWHHTVRCTGTEHAGHSHSVMGQLVDYIFCWLLLFSAILISHFESQWIFADFFFSILNIYIFFKVLDCCLAKSVNNLTSEK